ncbi:autotransporter-associated beta strand repeat-containing protein [Pseudomonas alkylphenolica]|uniref:autotransporter-associated beta strand repeat-containing protein n=1 Tax=Pseudomonas alkylphenolica TaxID=237609 RepID=UPI0018D91649|nr:autotransporter-associated beta strand repeat-containing protein [Pseudomonas alkylphenolica]MBH3428224.1 autotransporter-associated beta strand repeat-containing protein [Pseudomonas alkylphenolica]
MNHVFALVWNASQGAWTVTHEYSKRCGKGTRRLSKLALASLLLSAGFSSSAFAACAVTNLVVDCSGIADLIIANNFSSPFDGLTVNVNPGSLMNAPIGGTAMNLTGNNITLNNRGAIDPSAVGLVTLLSNGAVIGNGLSGAVLINNEMTGSLVGTVGLMGLTLNTLQGMALNVNNGASGSTTIVNNGTISSRALLGLYVPGADAPVVAVHGGSRVNMTNNGTVIGRIAFEASPDGNTFVNAGSIQGSVSLGAHSTGTNRFTAITGSSVSAGGGIGSSLGGLPGGDLTFAATGQVDGGAGGNNELILQNSLLGFGGGLGGSGTVSSANYVNFNQLTVNSGTWMLQGPLTSGSTRLNGGLARFDNNGAFGSGVLTSNGGAIEAVTNGLTLYNPIDVGPFGGLTVAGDNSLALAGGIYGVGGLTKLGTGNLTLAGFNALSGPLNIQAGSVTTLLNNSWSYSPSVNVSAGASLNLDSDFSIGSLAGSGSVRTGVSTLTVGGDNTTTTFSGDLSGTGNLSKTGSGTLSLIGTKTYTGTTSINAGTLYLSGSLASSQVSVNSGGTLRGNGTLSGALSINNGGSLALVSGSNLTADSLALNAYSGLDVVLGAPSTTSLLNVGDLTLDGNLYVTDTFGFGAGVYRLIDYTGSLVDNGLELAGLPNGFGLSDLVVQTAIGNQVNLLVAAPNQNIRFWDGSQTIPNGVIDGGNGTWNALGTNWTDVNGVVNRSWAGDFAVFQGTAGTVTVNGTQLLTGMQFVTDGYNLVSGAAGQLTAVNGTNGSTAVRVDSGATATVGVAINGSGTLNKIDSGTLVLSGANTYTGGTLLSGGTLVVGSNNALGSGQLTAAHGTQLDSNTTVVLGNALTLAGDLNVNGSNALTLNGVVGGVGGLIKNGVSTLTLGANNTFLGPVLLNGGGLVVGADSALSTGILSTADGTTLDASTAVALSNTVIVTGNLGIGGTADLTLNGFLLGNGGLIKYGAAGLTLSGSNAYIGGTTLTAGTLTVGGNGALGMGNLRVTGASNLDSSTAVSLNNYLELDATLTNTASNDLTLGGVISGAGALSKSGNANLTLNGLNTYQGGTTLNAGTLTLGTASALGSGALTATGNATLDTSAALLLANNVNVNANLNVAGSNHLTLTGVVAGAGTLSKSGQADLTLTGNNTFSGMFDVTGGRLLTLGNNALGNGSSANVDASASLNLGGNASLEALTGNGTVQTLAGNTLTLGGINHTGTFDGSIVGGGNLSKVGSGTLTLSGMSGITGTTQVNGGTLNLSGSLASAQVNVTSGSTLTGEGTVLGAVSVNNGGHLALSSGSTLSTGSLILDANSNFDATLGAPTLTPLLTVNGNLLLDGNLNVTDAGGFGVGVYRLIDYTGALIDNGLEFAGLPNGYGLGDLVLQTAIGSQVNLLVSAPNYDIRFWDGSQSIANGSVEGGSGTWNAGSTNWTSVNGTINQTWAGDFAVFQGAAGTVTVNGTQLLTGMQFVTDGYDLVSGTAGQLTAVNGTSGTTAVRVDPGVTATVGVAINGSGILNKLDNGTLVLNGANTYTGGTLLNGGTLVVGSNNALGSGQLTAAGGTQLDSNTAVVLGNGVTLDGNLNVSGSNALTLNGVIDGAGGLTKNGASLLTLGASNTFVGPVLLNDGGLVLGADSALGAGTLAVANGTTLDASTAVALSNAVSLTGSLGIGGTADLTLNGTVNGIGSLVKYGVAGLTLTGNNAYSGGTTLAAGALTVGSNSALGLGNLTVGGASTLDSSTAVTLGNDMVLNASLTNVGSHDLTLGGVISGTGGLSKNGNANLTLNGTNLFQGGTLLNAGTLTLGTASALGSGAMTVAGNATLATGAPLVLANNVNVNANLNIAGVNNLTLGGVIAGAGTLSKSGLADLTLSGNNTFSGAFDVLSGSLSTLGNSALGNDASVNLGSGAALNLGGSANIASLSGGGTANVGAGNTLSLGASNLSNTFVGTLSGSGALAKLGTGTLTLTGSNTLTGGTTIDAGTLKVDGSLDSAHVQVNSGATLTGAGSLGGAVTVADGGHLAVSSGSALAMNALVLENSANLDVDLSAPVTGGGNGLLDVAGNLTLDGTLNVSDLGGFGTGVYRLINYTGTLTDNGLAIGSVPGNVTLADLQLQTVIANQLNLLVAAPDVAVQFWDGAQQSSNGAVDGGSGSWGTGNANWTSVDGTSNQAWAQNFAVFQGTPGTVTVNGTQGLTGMQFVSDGYHLVAGAGAELTLSNGSLGTASVRVDPKATATIDIAVNGAGTLGKYDSGTLVLNGNNGYTGGTALNGGTLVVGHDNALGTGGLTVADGTTLDSNSAVTLRNAVALNGNLTLAGSHDLTLSGVISGNGALNKQGDSELTLSGNNTFSGALNVLNGTLNLIGNTALGNANLNVADTASVSVGGLNILNALGGTGALTLAAGSTLQVGASGASSVYDGFINGAGRLVKVGDGKQVLNNSVALGGGTLVAGGSLIVGGAAGSSALLGSDVDVAQGAMLGGHGRIVGDVELGNGATLNPGNSIGTLTVDGDISFDSGSTLVIEADPDGRSDRLVSTGTVSLGGANLSVQAGTGSWAPSTQYNIIQASSLNGTFGSVSSNLAFLTPQLTYASNGVTLNLARNDVAFTSVAQTYNQRAVSGALDAADAGGVYDAIAVLSADEARAAYDSLSGEIHASTRGALFDDSRYVRDAIGTRLRSAQGQAPGEGILHVDADSGMTFWIQGYGGWGDSNGNHNVADLDHNSQGMLLGVDIPLNDTWRAGLAAGYGSSDLDVDGRNSSAQVDSTSLTAYLGGQWDALHVRLGASYAWNEVDSSRHVKAGSLQEHVKANYDASTRQVFGELGYAVQAGDLTLEPFVGLAHVEVSTDSFSEKGGSTALKGDSEKDRATYTSLGVRASTPAADVAGVPVSVQSSLAWQRVLDEPGESSRMTLAGYDSFTVKGVPVAQDTALVQLGVSAKIAPQASVDLGYSGQLGDGYSDHGVRLGLNIAF